MARGKKRSDAPDKGPLTRQGTPLNLCGRAEDGVSGDPARARAAFPSTLCWWLQAAGGISLGSPSG